MKSASFFSGIGGFDLGFERAGIQTIALCEFDHDCRTLLARRFKGVRIITDIRQIPAIWKRAQRPTPNAQRSPRHWTEILELLSTADIFHGGFPCQDLSVAGERAGLQGERSGLWFTFRRVIGLFRPPIVVLENVPGLLSSNQGLDFLTVLRGLADCGYDCAWRLLDAQFAGLAQRRERVFIVGCSGACTFGPEKVLFEPESLCWDPPTRRAARKDAASTPDGSAPSGGQVELAPTLEKRAGRNGATNFHTSGGLAVHEVTGTLGARKSAGGGLGTDMECSGGRVPQSMSEEPIPILEAGGRTGKSTTDPRAGLGVGDPGDPGDPMFTLQSGKQHAIAFGRNNTAGALNAHGGAQGRQDFESETFIVQPPSLPHTLNAGRDGSDQTYIPIDLTNGSEIGDRPGTVDCSLDRHNRGTAIIAFSGKDHGADASQDLAPTLRAMPHRESHMNGGGQVAVANQVGVRRLMPVECERLQGFDDGWTEGFSDSVRYRMLGNAVAVPCAEWIGKRIRQAHDRHFPAGQAANPGPRSP